MKPVRRANQRRANRITPIAPREDGPLRRTVSQSPVRKFMYRSTTSAIARLGGEMFGLSGLQADNPFRCFGQICLKLLIAPRVIQKHAALRDQTECGDAAVGDVKTQMR